MVYNKDTPTSKFIVVLLQTIDSQPLSDLTLSGQRIFLDNVQCAGNEESLLNCSKNLIGEHNCNQSEGAGVRCQGKCK